MQLTIQNVLPENARDYTLCHIACWQAAYRGIIPDEYLDNMPDEIESRAERLIKSLKKPENNNEFYYAEIDGKMAGRLIIGKSRDDDKPDAGEIGAIYLLREYWNTGSGRQLMDFAKNKLKSMGFSEIILWVLEDNARARRFYEKSGFIHEGMKKEIIVGKPLIEMRYVHLL